MASKEQQGQLEQQRLQHQARANWSWAGQRALVVTLAMAAVLLAAMYWRVFAHFVPLWLKGSTYAHCAVVPLIVAYLIWRQREHLTALMPQASVTGLVLLVLGLAVYVVGSRIGVRVIIGGSFTLVLLGLAAATMGWRVLRSLAVPLLLTFFLVPVPKHVLGHVAFPMQIISARATGVLGRLSGLAVTTQGVNMDLGGFRFVVAQECSGLNSLLALLLAAGVLVELMDLPLGRKFLVLALAPVIVLASNIVRLLSVLWAAQFFGPQFALDSLIHGTSDLVVYISAVLFLLLLISVLGGRSPSSQEGEGPAVALGEPRQGEAAQGQP
ncbi:MAG: exosortase/archaeosortase family protein [Armatimonadetes bacterium]|nr:exosortase/archaeosortase family protein [Armatimonadota bacterium]